jgi:hypothetical protein
MNDIISPIDLLKIARRLRELNDANSFIPERVKECERIEIQARLEKGLEANRHSRLVSLPHPSTSASFSETP